MPITINATPGDAAANSYETLAEFQTYLGLRLQLPAAVTALLAADPTEKLPKALLMATRALDSILAAKHKRLEVLQVRTGIAKFYVVNPYWTGAVATTTQALAWPRTAMEDANGNTIGSTTIPQALKDAESEFAILALTSDLTADNATIAAGLTSLKAGPVALSFKEFIQLRSLPQSVTFTLVPSWYVPEAYENVPQAQFRTAGPRTRCY